MCRRKQWRWWSGRWPGEQCGVLPPVFCIRPGQPHSVRPRHATTRQGAVHHGPRQPTQAAVAAQPTTCGGLASPAYTAQGKQRHRRHPLTAELHHMLSGAARHRSSSSSGGAAALLDSSTCYLMLLMMRSHSAASHKAALCGVARRCSSPGVGHVASIREHIDLRAAAPFAHSLL